jgi:outer membrane protein OmpA-like peptidoglycan-associated protein
MKKLITVVVLVSFLILPARRAYCQSIQGRWAIGLHGGVNMWYNDFNKRKVGPNGEFSLRYGLSRVFSLGVLGGYEELKSQQTPPFANVTYDYIKLHAFPVAVVGWFHILPGRPVSPYFYLGGGAVFYQRQDGGKNFIPDNKFRSSFHIPVGMGLEAFASSRVSLVFDLGVGVADDRADTYKLKDPEGYAASKIGINIYIGRSDADDEDKDGLTNGEERRLGTNMDVADSEGDGLKDGEEVKRYRSNPLRADTDGDGLKDGSEVVEYKTDPTKSDTDEDGLSDGEEVQKYMTDPVKVDTDGDSLPDGEEVTKHKSDPRKVDTDSDALSDWDEIRTFATDPSKADTDGDGLADGDEAKTHKSDPAKADTDGGGVNDGAEVARGTSPLKPQDDVARAAPLILERGKTVILEGVNFATGSAVLTRESERTLEKAFVALVVNPDVRVEIAGYTDNVGSAAINERLSQRRADAVKAWLVKRGIGARRMTTIGKGMRDPIAPNDVPEGRAQNRRIEFHVMK